MTEEGSDPIRSGFTPPPTDMALLSSNEANALCMKAARGAGLSWGLAEEAGYAAAWLYARGINGPARLLAHLNWVVNRLYPCVRLVGGESLVASGEGPLCPIVLGASLSDVAMLPHGSIGPVHAPVLLLPFVHQLSRTTARSLTLCWADGRVSVTKTGSLLGDLDALMAARTMELTLRAQDGSDMLSAEPSGPVPICQSILSELNTYAIQTTVPSSLASREDAGSLAGDND
jgi:hypothetical protein